MYHLDRRFIDEKVLQQYYFEKFMTSGKDDRLNLLPDEPFFKKYSENKSFKVLHPEVKILEKKPGVTKKGFIVDFVLYPSISSNFDEYVYIEMKYNLNGLNSQEAKKLRHPLLKINEINGKKSGGFAVVLVDDTTSKKPFPNDEIPVVKLKFEDFANWYLNNSIKMIDQLRMKLLPDHEPIRRRVPRNWVIYIGKEGGKQSNNYHEYGRKKGIWAFADDNKSTKELLKLETGDRIMFVQFGGWGRDSNRQIIAPGEKDPGILKITSSKSKRKGQMVNESKIKFHIRWMDIFVITKGYHIDFDDDSFEDDNWKKLPKKSIKEKLAKNSKKQFTQYITFDKTPQMESPGVLWSLGKSVIDRSEFSAKVPDEKEFLDAARSAMSSGNPKVISNNCLKSIRDKMG